MKTMELKLTGATLSGMRLYDDNYDNSAEVFTYEIGKYFDWVDDWYMIGDTLCISYTGTNPGKRAVMSRIETLTTWLETAE